MNKNKGITLITLIIIVVVILIMTGVSIRTLLNDDGLIHNAEMSVGKYNNKILDSKISLEKLNNYVNSEVNATRGTVTLTEEQYNNILTRLENLEKGVNPVGTIIAYSIGNKPEGYLICDGSEVSKDTYADLYNVIGTTYGTATDSNHFKLPDLRGEFLRGAGTAIRNTGSGENVGIHQDPTQHSFTYGMTYSPGTGGFVTRIDTSSTGDKAPTLADKYINGEGDKMMITGSSGDKKFMNLFYTSRPTNTSVLYCIKY